MFAKILAGLLAVFVLAVSPQTRGGMPESAKVLMMPYSSICTPSMTEMMSALTEDFGVHISMSFEESPESGIIVTHNPNTHVAAVLHVSEGLICLVFSGENLKIYARPESLNVQGTGEDDDEGS